MPSHNFFNCLHDRHARFFECGILCMAFVLGPGGSARGAGALLMTVRLVVATGSLLARALTSSLCTLPAVESVVVSPPSPLHACASFPWRSTSNARAGTGVDEWSAGVDSIYPQPGPCLTPADLTLGGSTTNRKRTTLQPRCHGHGYGQGRRAKNARGTRPARVGHAACKRRKGPPVP